MPEEQVSWYREILFAGVQNVNSLDGKSSISERTGIKFSVHKCVIFQTLCYDTIFTYKCTTTNCQNYSCFASKCPSNPKFWSNLLLHHQCLEPPTVKTTAIWMESEKLGQICNVFQDPKYSLALLRLFPDFHSTINKQGYSGGTSSDIVILV